MHKVILDCDNTMGVKKSDVDDGLTFAYLYAHPDVEVLAITCTFANNYQHVVYYNTLQMLEDLNIKDVDVYMGGRTPEAYDSAAVDYLVRTVNENPNEITVIAIGSLCNIAGAYQKDPGFFNKIKRLIIMGGITEPLYLNGVLCNELNFTIDHKSAAKVLYNCHNMSILSSQCTKDAVYYLEDLEAALNMESDYMKWAKPILGDWIKRKTRDYGNRPVFINWDLCTAIYMTNPELFDTSKKAILKQETDLETGLMQIVNPEEYQEEEMILVDIPDKINDLETFNDLFYTMLKRMK